MTNRPRLILALSAAVAVGLLVIPGGSAASKRGLDGSVVNMSVDDDYSFSLAPGAESVSAGDSLTGTHGWGFNINNSAESSLQGVQLQFNTSGSGNDYTNSNVFNFNYQFFTPDPNRFVTNDACPTPTAAQETCPSPSVTLPPTTGEMSLHTGPGSPVTMTPGYDASRTVTSIPSSSDEAVSVAVTLQDSRYAGGTAVSVRGFSDNADPNSTPTVMAGGQQLPSCPQGGPQPGGSACAYESDFGAYQNGSVTCESVSLQIANAQVGTEYVFGWQENESVAGCPTGEPAVGVIGWRSPLPQQPAPQACDAGTDCSATQSIPDLGNVTTSVGSGQGVTGFDIGSNALYLVNFPGENAPAPPSGTVSSGYGDSTTPDGKASATNDGATAQATGVGGITVSEWGSDPVTSPPFNASGNYFDVEILSGSSFDTLTIQECNLMNGDSFQWWNGTEWKDVTPTVYPDADGCVTATLSDDPNVSSPTISQLGGTIFAVNNAPLLAVAKSKLRLAGRHVTARLHCTRLACRGTATLERAKSKTNSRVLGHARYAIAAGKTATVRIVLNAAGRKALAKVRRSLSYAAKLSVTVTHGATVAAAVQIGR